MGSWYKTCGLSNLPILDGEQVYVFPIVQNLDITERCYSTAFWSPVMIPFLSEYNDYGVGTNSHQNIEYTLKGIREYMIEMEQGENKYHDIEVKKDKLDEELFFESVREGRLFVDYSGKQMVDFVMIKTSIVDHICKNLVLDKYVGGGKGNHGDNNNYLRYNWDDVVVDSTEVLTILISLLGENSEYSELMILDGVPKTIMLQYALRHIGRIFDYAHPNKAAAYLRRIDDYRMSRLVRPIDEVALLIFDGKLDEAHALLVDILRGMFIDSFMERTRRNWMPMGHDGDQSRSYDDYLMLCSAISAIIDKDCYNR